MFTSPRTIGPVSALSPWTERVVEGGGEQRAQRVGRVQVGVVHARRGQQLHGLGDQRDQVVGAVGQRRVVERALVLGHPHRAAAEVRDQLLGHLPLAGAGGDPEDAARRAAAGRRPCR